MKITLTFESLEEFQQHILISEKLMQPKAEEKPAAEKPAEPVKPMEKAPEKAPEPAPEGAPGEPVDEDFRTEVRKTLAALNKKVGKNVASGMIKKFGVNALTEVALSDLPALMNEAKEAIANAG